MLEAQLRFAAYYVVRTRWGMTAQFLELAWQEMALEEAHETLQAQRHGCQAFNNRMCLALAWGSAVRLVLLHDSALNLNEVGRAGDARG